MLVECECCKKEFHKSKAHYKRHLRHFCSIECYNRSRVKIIITSNCQYCNKKFSRSQKDYTREKNHFCSRNCAATHNNKIPKRKKKPYTKQCKKCTNLIPNRYTYCDQCIKEGYHIHNKIDDNQTISYYRKTGKNLQNYRYIRSCAKKIVRKWEKKCQHCGYDKHVEICHVRKISDFPDTATLAEINDPRNLFLLCPNCHWEFDSGLLTKEEIMGLVGLEPTTLRFPFVSVS